MSAWTVLLLLSITQRRSEARPKRAWMPSMAVSSAAWRRARLSGRAVSCVSAREETRSHPRTPSERSGRRISQPWRSRQSDACTSSAARSDAAGSWVCRSQDTRLVSRIHTATVRQRSSCSRMRSATLSQSRYRMRRASVSSVMSNAGVVLLLMDLISLSRSRGSTGASSRPEAY